MIECQYVLLDRQLLWWRINPIWNFYFWFWHCDIVKYYYIFFLNYYYAFWLTFPVIQDSLQRWDVAEYCGSLPAGLYSLRHKCISSQACQSPGRSTTRGARQILFCTKALHQSHYKTAVSSPISITYCGFTSF